MLSLVSRLKRVRLKEAEKKSEAEEDRSAVSLEGRLLLVRDTHWPGCGGTRGGCGEGGE